MIIATNSPKAGTPIAASMATDPRSSRLRSQARARVLGPSFGEPLDRDAGALA